MWEKGSSVTQSGRKRGNVLLSLFEKLQQVLPATSGLRRFKLRLHNQRERLRCFSERSRETTQDAYATEKLIPNSYHGFSRTIRYFSSVSTSHASFVWVFQSLGLRQPANSPFFVQF